MTTTYTIATVLLGGFLSVWGGVLMLSQRIKIKKNREMWGIVGCLFLGVFFASHFGQFLLGGVLDELYLLALSHIGGQLFVYLYTIRLQNISNKAVLKTNYYAGFFITTLIGLGVGIVTNNPALIDFISFASISIITSITAYLSFLVYASVRQTRWLIASIACVLGVIFDVVKVIDIFQNVGNTGSVIFILLISIMVAVMTFIYRIGITLDREFHIRMRQ